jgi:single-stranded-DNA-specific exonuclease
MLTASKRWQIAELPPKPYLNHLPDLHPVVAQILYNRGLTAPDEAIAFLEDRPRPHTPLDLRGMPQAVNRLRQALQKGERVAVYGDFDTDGVTATALLTLTLQALGGKVRPYIPHRVKEGYGLNVQALEELAQEGVRVVVTVDCGIRFPKEVAYARQRGMDVIITDHHTVGEEHLDAIAVINPHQPDCPYPYKELAGVGLAYKLAQVLLRADREEPGHTRRILQAEDLLDLVALGTVADLAPLTGENRSLVIRGLQRLNSAPRPGMEALMRKAGLRPGKVDAAAIGYSLGPRLNAAGRVAHADTAYQLLVAEYPGEADMLAQQLDDLNRERQKISAEVQQQAQEITATHESGQLLLFIADPRFPIGVVGLVASRLMEEFYRPAVVVEKGEKKSRASARSIPEFHIAHALDACADLFIQHGGHAAAGGFTAHTKDLPEIEARLKALAAEQLEGKDLAPTLHVDAEVPLQEMAWPLWQTLQKLQPFGEGNPEPLFVSRNARVRRCRAVGTGGAHLKLLLYNGQAVWDGIAFHQGEWFDHLPNRVDIAFHLQLNEWRGEQRLQLNIQDIRPAGQEESPW